jgi:Ca2+-binding EF-hand superfamily protein
MKKFVAIVGGLVLASGVALAGDQSSTEGQAKSFNELDENQDGVVTQTEASADQNLVAQFQTADANQDGYLTPAEYDTIQQETEEAE